MARKKINPKTGIGAIFADNLKFICNVRHMTDEQVMDYMGICRATYYNRMSHPERWTASDMDSAAKLFKIPVADLVSRMLTREEVAA